jgi:hypothetical protein
MADIKCIRCTFNHIGGKNLATDKPLWDALVESQPASYIYKGEALCVEHLHEQLVHESIRQDILSKAILNK